MSIFVFAYWDWCKEKGYNVEQSKNRDLVSEFYHTDFHIKNPKYQVTGIEYYIVLN